MKVGIWLNKGINPTDGGSFSYLEKLIKRIDSYEFHPQLEIVFISESERSEGFIKEVLNLTYNRKYFSFLGKIKYKLSSLAKKQSLYNDLVQKNDSDKTGKYSEILRRNKVDVIFYPQQWNCEIEDYPFVATNWDIGHLSTYNFPEFDRDYNLRRRNKWFNDTIYKALIVFCESEAGKSELLKYTHLDELKIKVIPIFPGNCVSINMADEEQNEVLTKYDLIKNQFFFYPAQFWAHKNHVGLVNAFAHFVKSYPHFKLVLSGTDKGNLHYIETLTKGLGIYDRLIFTGFTGVNEIYTFYCNAMAMIMPSIFGPTNLPILEALELNCPVLCSDLPGYHEMIGDGALYFNPLNHDSILASMNNIVDTQKRYELLSKAEEVRRTTNFRVEKSLERLDESFLSLVNIRKTWDH